MIVENSDRNSSMCRCSVCPVTDDCMQGQNGRLYCSRGRTVCDPSGPGCLCPDCPVAAENRIGGRHFCIEGASR